MDVKKEEISGDINLLEEPVESEEKSILTAKTEETTLIDLSEP